MTKFLTLTNAFTNQPLLVSIDTITYVQKANAKEFGDSTHIWCVRGSSSWNLYVKELVSDIEAMLDLLDVGVAH